MREILLVPTGGLCNRMRAIASCLFWANSLNLPLKVMWNNYAGLRADFHNLFEPVTRYNISMCENKRWLFNINGRKDYLKRALLLKMMYQTSFNYAEQNSGSIIGKFNPLVGKNMLVISCYSICKHIDYASIFVPIKAIQTKVDEIASSFSENTIGIHIRRTDNTASIQKSPLEMFVGYMKEELARNAQTMFYLALDDNAVKEELKKQFDNHIITYDEIIPERDSLQGMMHAVTELYILSRTRKIYGSYASSYSQTAAEIGHAEYIQVMK